MVEDKDFGLSNWTSCFLKQEGSVLESSGAEELRFGHSGLTFRLYCGPWLLEKLLCIFGLTCCMV